MSEGGFAASPRAGVHPAAETIGGTERDGGMSVVVCTHAMRRRDQLAAAVASLEHQTVPPAEVLVVVDHNAELVEWVTGRWPGVTVVENAEARGLSGARNTGLARARGSIVGFLDDDARAAADWVERMSSAFDDPRVIGVGGTVAPEWEGGRPAWFPREFDWVVGCTYRGMPETPGPVRNVIGASMSFRREVVVGAGAFRSELGRVGSLPVGCEETELCIRAGRAHPRSHVLFDPAIRVDHLVPRDRATVGYFLSRCYAEGRSKAMVARLAGAQQALETERRYVSRTLPSGVARGLADAPRRGRAGGLGRAGAIVAGLAATTAGYTAARLAAGGRPAA